MNPLPNVEKATIRTHKQCKISKSEFICAIERKHKSYTNDYEPKSYVNKHLVTRIPLVTNKFHEEVRC